MAVAGNPSECAHDWFEDQVLAAVSQVLATPRPALVHPNGTPNKGNGGTVILK